MANEVSVATQVSKTRAFKPGRTPPLQKMENDRFTYMRFVVCVLYALLYAFSCKEFISCLAMSSRLAVGSSDRRVGSAFVRVSVWVFACVCMRFCMFVSAFVMRSYVRSFACCES